MERIVDYEWDTSFHPQLFIDAYSQIKRVKIKSQNIQIAD